MSGKRDGAFLAIQAVKVVDEPGAAQHQRPQERVESVRWQWKCDGLSGTFVMAWNAPRSQIESYARDEAKRAIAQRQHDVEIKKVLATKIETWL